MGFSEKERPWPWERETTKIQIMKMDFADSILQAMRFRRSSFQGYNRQFTTKMLFWGG